MCTLGRGVRPTKPEQLAMGIACPRTTARMPDALQLGRDQLDLARAETAVGVDVVHDRLRHRQLVTGGGMEPRSMLRSGRALHRQCADLDGASRRPGRGSRADRPGGAGPGARPGPGRGPGRRRRT
jgi:hypothetical protein